MIKVSIVIPVYNPGKKLDKCIKSVLNQTFKDWELILVNDGSTDNSLDICKKYQQIDNRIIVIDKENEGTVPTRRRGIEAASSELITFVDADDWIDKEMIGTLFYEIEIAEADIIVCNTYRVIGNGSIIKQKNSSNYFKENRIYTGESIKSELASAYLWGHPFPAALHGKMYKKELLLQSGKYTEGITIIGDDLFYNLEMFLKADKIRVISDTFYYYRLGGTTSKYMPDLFKDIVLGYEVQKEIIEIYYTETWQYEYRGISIMLLNMFDRCLYGLFLGSLKDNEIKNMISEYVSNKSLIEAVRNEGSQNYFSNDYLHAIESGDINYLYARGEKQYRKRKPKQLVMNTISKVALI